MNLRSLLSLCTLISAAALSLPATAATYCVNNVSSLAAAFTSANGDPEGSIHDIRVRSGTYAVSAGLTFEPAGDKDGKDFSITGGWNADCSARTINSAATVFNGENGATDADFRFYGNNARYVVEGIRFFNFREVIVDDANCGFDCPDTSAIRVRYNEFRNGIDTVIRAKDAAQLTVTNNLFANLTPGAGEAVGIYYANTELPPVIAFNTIADVNCSLGGGNALYVYNLRSGATLHHNLVQQVGCSATISVANGSQPLAFRNNLYHTLNGVPPSSLNGNVVTPSPSFVNSAAGNYHLQESGTLSPAINAGMTPIDAQTLGLFATIPSQDLDGPAGARLIGTRYDIGAYESSINNSSVLTVVNENDSGAGSLRAAITSANASPGLQKIEFNIAGSCVPTPHLILLSSPLPDITDSLEIDGYSEPESAANTLTNGSDAVLCVLVGAASGTLAQALQVPVGEPAATSLTVKGIAFLGSTGFNGNFTVALRLRGGSNHVIQGNAFAGTGPGSVGSLGTMNFGLQIRDTAQNVLVGGADPEHRNSFGAMNSSAIVLNDATSGGHTIQNNYIGLSASGQTASPIGLNGIFASASPNIQILDNVISAVGSSVAISITGATATGYLVQRNRLGVNAFGIPTAAFRNGTGISIAGGAGDNQIGALGGITASNLITNSDDAGVWITTTAGTGNVVRPNQIYGNGQGGVGMGIDIGPLGQSANDPQDPDTGPNNGQNFPTVINSLPNPDGTREVTVALDSKPNTNFRVDIYRSPDCPGGNRGGNMVTRIGGYAAVTNAAGQMTTTVTANGGGSPGILVAIATNQATGDTSEPSLCYIEPNATTTTITNDSPDPSQIGQAYTVTVLVISQVGEPSGSVTVSDGQGNQCTDNSLSGGIGSCQLPSTSVGNKTLTANYLGSITHAPSSDTAPHTVVAAITTTTIVSDLPDPSEVGQPYAVNVQVRTQAGNTATPGGQVAVSDGSGQTCQIVSLSGGNGSCQLTSVSVGNKTLSASYAGAINFLASSDTEAHIVVAASTTTTITSDAPDPSLPGQAYNVMVNVNPDSNNYTFEFAGGASIPAGGSLVAGSQEDEALVNLAVPAGFNFSVYGTPVSGGSILRVGTNGVLMLNAVGGNPYENKALPSTGPNFPALSPVLMPYWDDLDGRPAAVNGGGIYQQLTGSAPNRQWTIEWRGEHFNDPSSAVTIQFAIAFYEGSSQFTYLYALTGGTHPSGSSATIGVQAATTGGAFTQYSFNSVAVAPGNQLISNVPAVLPAPVGSVLVGDGSGASCNITLANGNGACQLTSAALGNKTLSAAYTPSSQAFAASNDTEDHLVALAASTTTITSDTPDPSSVGQAYLVQVSVSGPGTAPTGTVVINDGSGAVCNALLSNSLGQCQLVSTSGGNKTLTANYPGDSNFTASSDTEAHVVDAIATTTTITSDNPDPSTVGVPYTVVVTVGAGFGTPGGSVNVDDGSGANCQITLNAGGGSCQLISASVGNKTLTASYVGNASYLTSSDTEAHTVNPGQAAATTTTITSDLPEPSVVGQPYSVSVSVVSGAGTVTGSVNINNGVGPGSSNCQAPLVNGSGSCQLTGNAAGLSLLTACLQANASFASSCDNEDHSVSKADTSIAINSVLPNPATEGQPVTVSLNLDVLAPGAGTPTGTLSVSASPAEQCTITLPATSCQLTPITAGNRSITISYPGDANFNLTTRTTNIVVQPDQLLKNGFE